MWGMQQAAAEFDDAGFGHKTPTLTLPLEWGGNYFYVAGCHVAPAVLLAITN